MFQRDQSRSEKRIARSLKGQVKESIAAIFLVSPKTLEAGAAQWMELAYADEERVRTEAARATERDLFSVQHHNQHWTD